MPEAPILVWFRRDLRLADNPALAEAAASGRPIVPVFIRDDAAAGSWTPGGASRWWLHHSLASLLADLARAGARLVLRSGDSATILRTLIVETGAEAVFWNRLYEPWATARDAALKSALGRDGIEVRSFNAGLLFEPWEVRTQAGDPFKVFTPFQRACLAASPPPPPAPAPRRLRAPAAAPAGESLESWRLLPTRPDWAGGLCAAWIPGERGAAARLERFLDAALARYPTDRDRPDREGTSRLSPHLHFGEIGPRQAWHAARVRDGAGVDKFIAELLWREFSHHLLFHFPELPERNWRRDFDDFPWARNPHAGAAWRRGRTGYPIVDAGMRELWATGWMHNRVRMIVGSFLVKDLLLPWQEGAAWFWDTLVDADLANNSAGWQWVAGSGADAAPYFRVFNPVLQGRKFDPDGAYVKRWCPELAALPPVLVHQPWDADDATLAAAGVRLGDSYPRRIVDHREARSRALAAFARITRAA